MALADAVLDLPGLCPAAASLAALSLERDTATAVRRDPGAVLFLARQLVPFQPNFDVPLNTLDDSFLLAALELVQRGKLPFVDWRQPGLERVWRASQMTAAIAESLAEKAGVPTSHAFAAGMLAPLGWLAVCAADPHRVPEYLDSLDRRKPDWQVAAWGLDHASLARRLVRAWRLPAWLADVVGHLDWHLEVVARLGVDPKLFAAVQLAVLATQKSNVGLGLAIGTPLGELCDHLGLTDDAFAGLVADDKIVAIVPSFDSPASQPLLADVIRLTLDNRRRHEKAWIDQLNRDIDRLECALNQHIADESQRLVKQKLTALAEFAGGAGHEINNPLAVISGQAQYVIKQMNWAEELLLEEPTPAAMLEALKAKLTKPLQTIVSQSQRIHHVITDVMQFARPQTPRPTVVSVAKLLSEVAASVRPLAEDRRVRLVCPEAPAQLAIRVDPGQIRLALSNLMRNAIEAAPADGWATVRMQREPNGDVSFAVEDNGLGIADHLREHLFDPFYSGRSAGRGRGLGLSTAWRLVRLHGGDVRLDTTTQGVTRFYLTLPATEVIDSLVPANGKREAVGYHLSNV